MSLKNLFFITLFSLLAFAPNLRAMSSPPLDEKSEETKNSNKDQASQDDMLIIIELNDENEQTVFSIGIPYQAIQLSKTLTNSMSDTNEENRIITISFDKINEVNFNELKTSLKLLKVWSLNKLAAENIASILTKKSILKLINVIDYLDCLQLRTIFIDALYLKIKKLVFEKDKFPKAIKFIKSIQDPDLYEKLFDLVDNNLKNKNRIKHKFMHSNTLNEHSKNVRYVCTSHNGALVASISDDQNIRIWDIKTGTCIHVLQDPDRAYSAHFSPDDNKLFYVTNRSLKTWDLKISGSHEGAIYLPEAFALSSDCKKYTIPDHCEDKTISLYDLDEYRKIKTLNGHTDTVNATAFSHDNSILASSSNDRTTKIWDLATNTCTDTINECGTHLAFSPDNKNLAIATKDSIIIWNIKMNRCEQHLKGHTNLVSSIYFSADGTLLASASFDETVKIWDIKTGQCLQTLTQHIDFVESVCFTPDNTKLISSSMDQTINIYSRCNIKEEFTLSTLLFLDYALSYKTLETWEQLPSEEFYFDLYYELPEVFQKMIIDMFDQDALNSYLEIKKN